MLIVAFGLNNHKHSQGAHKYKSMISNEQNSPRMLDLNCTKFNHNGYIRYE